MNIEDIIERAETDPAAWDECIRVAEELARRGEPLPLALVELMADAMRGDAVRPFDRKAGAEISHL